MSRLRKRFNPATAEYTLENQSKSDEFDTSIPRAGKWSLEEENFAKKLIIEFESGTLKDCEDGCTLRSYLARRLNCAPMRISKKFAGKCIGKHVFARCTDGSSQMIARHTEKMLENPTKRSRTVPKRYRSHSDEDMENFRVPQDEIQVSPSTTVDDSEEDALPHAMWIEPENQLPSVFFSPHHKSGFQPNIGLGSSQYLVSFPSTISLDFLEENLVSNMSMPLLQLGDHQSTSGDSQKSDGAAMSESDSSNSLDEDREALEWRDVLTYVAECNYNQFFPQQQVDETSNRLDLILSGSDQRPLQVSQEAYYCGNQQNAHHYHPSSQQQQHLGNSLHHGFLHQQQQHQHSQQQQLQSSLLNHAPQSSLRVNTSLSLPMYCAHNYMSSDSSDAANSSSGASTSGDDTASVSTPGRTQVSMSAVSSPINASSVNSQYAGFYPSQQISTGGSTLTSYDQLRSNLSYGALFF